MLFSEPKIPQFCGGLPDAITKSNVSVLFSEPKIPQWFIPFDNAVIVKELFQCSSASRKFLNPATAQQKTHYERQTRDSFSALQRAENSSIYQEPCQPRMPLRFQCSSASRKFLNLSGTSLCRCALVFQCSSASRKFLNGKSSTMTTRSRQFQCSSASRKFLNSAWRLRDSPVAKVSVLFSEPKIPQS